MSVDNNARKRANRAKKIASTNSTNLNALAVDPRDIGAKADVWTFTYGQIQAGALNVLILPNALWRPSAVTPGNPIVVRGVGVGGADLVTTIVSASGNQITMAASASGPFSGAVISGYFGTDDAPAINAAIQANSFPSGPWSVTATQPTWGGTNNSAGEWIQGPAKIVLKSYGRNNGMIGILSPIRLSTGCQIEFQTSVIALPGFSGQAMIHQNVNGSGVTQQVGMVRVYNARLLCSGFAQIGIWLEYCFNVEFLGNVNIFQAGLTGVRIGNVSGGGGSSLCSFTGRVNCTGVSIGSAPVGTTRDNTGTIGFQYIGNTADNTVNGDVWCQGFRTGYWDNGGSNNKVHGTVHCWTGRLFGYMTTAVRLGGGGYYISRILSDSAANVSGSPAYAVLIEGVGHIGEVNTVWNFNSNDTVSNQFIEIQNNTSGSSNVIIDAVLAYTNNASYKIAAVIAGTTSNLIINSISTDGNYNSLGYNLESVNRANADATLQSQITNINSVLPGQPWTPSQLTVSQMPLWLDAAQTNTLTINNSNQVTAWASRIGTAVATVPTSYTAPTYSATGFRSTKPGVTFDGAVYGNALDLGSSSNGIFQGSSDFLVFAVLTRNNQVITNVGDRHCIFFMIAGPSGNNIQFATHFESQTNDSSQNLVINIGAGQSSATAVGVSGTSMILEAYATANYPPSSYAVGLATTAFTANTFKNKSTGGYQAGTYTTGSFVANTLIGNSPYSATGTLNAAFTLCELIVIQGAAVGNTTIIQDIEGYLANKWWGLSTSSVLTTTHPYYLVLPANPAFVTSAAQTGFVQTTSTTVANTTTTTSMLSTGVGSLTLPTNTLVAGKNYRLRAAGSLGTTSTPGNLTLTLTLGGVSLGTAVLQDLPASTTGAGWQAEFDIVCRTTGTSGTSIASGSVSHDKSPGRSGASFNPTASVATIPTNQSNTFGLTATWATANASNTITTTTVELVAMN